MTRVCSTHFESFNCFVLHFYVVSCSIHAFSHALLFFLILAFVLFVFPFSKSLWFLLLSLNPSFSFIKNPCLTTFVHDTLAVLNTCDDLMLELEGCCFGCRIKRWKVEGEGKKERSEEHTSELQSH